jgi:hypothetical protein
MVAALRLDRVDERLQRIDRRHVVVFVDVLQRLKRGIQLGIYAVVNPLKPLTARLRPARQSAASRLIPERRSL